MHLPTSPLVMRVYCLLLLLICGIVVELFYQTGGQWLSSQRRIQTVTQAAAVRARLESEITSATALGSGLASYLTARHDSQNPEEIDSVLASLFRQSRHVRNFGVAMGYRIAFVYPPVGNEQALGQDYHDLSEQWPLVEKTIETRTPLMAGPLELAQGGSGLIYRIPVYVGDQYWGMVSTVLDSSSVFAAAGLDGKDSRYAYALRGADATGASGAVFFGAADLFDQQETLGMDVDVPGGRWLLAVKPAQEGGALEHWLLLGRLAGWTFSVLFAYLLWSWLLLHRRMAELALYDTLTGLPNRNLLMDRLSQMIHRADRQGRPLSLLYIDLDGFKRVNDTLGHKVGDMVLLEVATRLHTALRRSDTVTRWGGDEFVALLGSSDREAAAAIAENLCRAVDAPIQIGDQEVKVGASVGIAVYPDDGDNATALMRLADLRMYHQKEERRRPVTAEQPA